MSDIDDFDDIDLEMDEEKLDEKDKQFLNSIQENSDAYSDEDVNNAMFKSTKDIDQTLYELKIKYGDDIKVAVLPLGPLTIPYVEE